MLEEKHKSIAVFPHHLEKFQKQLKNFKKLDFDEFNKRLQEYKQEWSKIEDSVDDSKLNALKKKLTDKGNYRQKDSIFTETKTSQKGFFMDIVN